MRITVIGAAGRMGRQIISDILLDEDLEISGAIDSQDCSHLNKDVGELIGIKPLGLKISDSLEYYINDTDVVVDFSLPEAIFNNLKISRDKNKPYVTGITGLDLSIIKFIKESSSPLLKSNPLNPSLITSFVDSGLP